MKCRFCNHALTHEFVDLVNSPPSNSYLRYESLNAPEVFFPLKLFVCDKCFLVQIDEYKSASEIFDKEYAYFSSFSTSWLAHCRKYTQEMMHRFNYNSNSQVIEIASNDGYLLQYFKQYNVPVLGIEPTESTATEARQKGIETITEFFGVPLAQRLVSDNRKADLLFGNNVLAHVPDINDFVKGMKLVLKDTGVVTMEFPHLLELVRNNQFDTIYHEHFSYLSFRTVKEIFATHGLTIFDVQEIPTHGGSLRIFARHRDDSTKSVLPSVNMLLKKEDEAGLGNINFYQGFQSKVDQVKIGLLNFLLNAKVEGKRIAAYGAAAKGNTLLNYCGVRKDLVDFVVDASPYKQGKFMPGSHIPIVSEDRISTEKPDFVLILPWNIKDEIQSQLSYIRQWEGKFVTAIPDLQII
jgi:2-polyprenyl-3-methyl-5-hydroxy-6-metoxy-1,4-benzoquinol methylase